MNKIHMLLIALACVIVTTVVEAGPFDYRSPVIHNFSKPCRNPHRFWNTAIAPIEGGRAVVFQQASPVVYTPFRTPVAVGVGCTPVVPRGYCVGLTPEQQVAMTRGYVQPVVATPAPVQPVVAAPVAPQQTTVVVEQPRPPRTLVGASVLGLKVGVGY